MGVELRTDNPFSTGFVYKYEEGDESLERFKLNHVPSEKDKLHTVRDYDNLSDISFDYYGNSKYWWIIADINNIDNPFELLVNSNLIIPDLDSIKASAL